MRTARFITRVSAIRARIISEPNEGKTLPPAPQRSDRNGHGHAVFRSAALLQALACTYFILVSLFTYIIIILFISQEKIYNIHIVPMRKFPKFRTLTGDKK